MDDSATRITAKFFKIFKVACRRAANQAMNGGIVIHKILTHLSSYYLVLCPLDTKKQERLTAIFESFVCANLNFSK
jgi:hypothetical protein